MSNARNLARVIVDSSGDIAAGNLDNAVPADGSITAAKLASTLDLSSKTLSYPDASVSTSDLETAAKPVGAGQTWQVVTGSRAFGTTYTNTTGRPIVVSVQGQGLFSQTWNFLINGTIVRGIWANGAGPNELSMSMVVPAGATYQLTTPASGSLKLWSELR